MIHSNNHISTKNKISISMIGYKAILSLVIIAFTITNSHAQDAEVPRPIGVHVGLNRGLLTNSIGPSISVHYGFRTLKFFQPEVALSYNYQKGSTFMSGHDYTSSAISLTPGLRLNFRPKKDWNPALFLMLGIAYGQYKTNRQDDLGRSGFESEVNLGISNTFYKKHMVTLGYFSDDFIDGIYLKYGYWFGVGK